MRAFQDREFDVEGAGSFDEAIAAAQIEPPELALVDLRLSSGAEAPAEPTSALRSDR